MVFLLSQLIDNQLIVIIIVALGIIFSENLFSKYFNKL